jgi:DNA polymerase I-like protein with 3'-5' exonuclease and polymerase domains
MAKPLQLVFDLETDGLLHELTKIHSMVLRDVETDDVCSCAEADGYEAIESGLYMLSQADLIIGHNIVNFDIRAIRKIYPNFRFKKTCRAYDTLLVSRVLWPELEPVDDQKFSHIPKKYRGRHSLGAWGERLNTKKIDFGKDKKVEEVWDVWSEEMQVFGFPFDERSAYALINKLKNRREQIDEQLQEVFPTITEERISEKTGKRLKDKVIVFNPASRKQTAERLQEKYPSIRFDATEKGNVKVDDDVLDKLGKKYPEAALLSEYQLLNKRLGQIADGKEAWVKHSQKYKDGRIHGSIITNACVSGRCSHRGPNTGQIPSVGQPYGSECRALFYAPNGWVLVGADASGLELRALGAWLAHFDGGEYAKLVSTQGFDIHTHNAKLFGIYDGQGEIAKKTRDLSKRLIYALLYGAGQKKVGSVMDIKLSEQKQMDLGKKTIDTFYKNLPAIKQLKDKIDERITTRGYLTGIDGRHLQIRSRHSALNQLLQSTGAISVKKATCILYDDLHKAGLRWGCHYGFVAHVHDEIQALVKPQHVSVYKDLAIKCFEKAGEYFQLLCPLTGEAKEGKNWMETH